MTTVINPYIPYRRVKSRAQTAYSPPTFTITSWSRLKTVKTCVCPHQTHRTNQTPNPLLKPLPKTKCPPSQQLSQHPQAPPPLPPSLHHISHIPHPVQRHPLPLLPPQAATPSPSAQQPPPSRLPTSTWRALAPEQIQTLHKAGSRTHSEAKWRRRRGKTVKKEGENL